MPYHNSSKKSKKKSSGSGYSARYGDKSGPDHGYMGGDMKGTTSEKSYYRPMDSY